jgi:sugar (pentulose or hexulose) kinase
MDELFAKTANREVQAIAVDSTSGTVLPVADDGTALGNADLPSEMWSADLPPIRLPEVLAPGKPFGILCDALRKRWGLTGICFLVTGATDSNAAFYASGAAAAGDWSTTIGTTLAVKGLSATRIDDPEARIYCHKHPDGMWLPGDASNAGGEILRARFGHSSCR